MITSAVGIALIKEFEGLELTPYMDGGVWTAGYGHSFQGGFPLGGDLTLAEAETLLAHDVAFAGLAVERLCGYVLGESQPKFDALVSFVFNLGWSSLAHSTLLLKVRAGDMAGAAEEFAKWDKVHVNGLVVSVPGLTRRRRAERALFLS